MSKPRYNTGNENYDAILERYDELKKEHGSFDKPTSVPANFSVELGEYRMNVAFERVGGKSREAA